MIKQDPDHLEARVRLANVLEDMGKQAEALEIITDGKSLSTASLAHCAPFLHLDQLEAYDVQSSDVEPNKVKKDARNPVNPEGTRQPNAPSPRECSSHKCDRPWFRSGKRY